MIRISLMLLGCGVAAFGQLMSGSNTFPNGTSFSYETRVEPPTPSLDFFGAGGTLTEKGVAKRHMVDMQRKTYFGYDLRIEPLAGDRFQVTFSPLSINPAKMAEIFPKVTDWTMIPLPGQPAPQVVHLGDKIALTMFVNPSTGQKIVEYITIGGGRGRLITASGPARDFSPEQDLWVEMYAPRLTINGKPFEISHSVIPGISGSPLRIYIAGYGRFVFLLEPRPEHGLRKAGEVRGSTMSWRWGADEFVLNSDRKIAPGMGAYNLYVYHDPRYRPKDGSSFELGAGGSLEHLIR